MDIRVDDYRLKEGDQADLTKWPTLVDPVYESKKDYRKLLKDSTKELSKLQYNMYASDTYSLLIIFQAMDAAGKDGAIQHVMSGVNPQGCQVFSFKHPSQTDLDHDFLWRTNNCLPERGRIGIFNRSYYEEVLIVRVHPEILAAERLPDDLDAQPAIWPHRYDSILELEKHLHRNGTRVVKFFLHLSKEEQRKRFLARIDKPEKNWKFNIDDVKERDYWDDYMKAYAEAMSATSTKQSPWYIVPADDKKTTRLVVSRVILDTMKSLDFDLPELSPERVQELHELRGKLT